jgi:hypothetical protein
VTQALRAAAVPAPAPSSALFESLLEGVRTVADYVRGASK